MGYKVKVYKMDMETKYGIDTEIALVDPNSFCEEDVLNELMQRLDYEPADNDPDVDGYCCDGTVGAWLLINDYDIEIPQSIIDRIIADYNEVK